MTHRGSVYRPQRKRHPQKKPWKATMENHKTGGNCAQKHEQSVQRGMYIYVIW
ncbi:hypothetical protein PROFUN_13028 [Planoprotostelium fungivorum]|uniref:Uncharacterized protein n=1 Tax=Planoprotostelium fungivorum TaxID=1890364 RepID=A0A2P6N5K2_9EUKA|nr:hypothetical protein PROFUN_13028 [Planoprotostelium fungivorum]